MLFLAVLTPGCRDITSITEAGAMRALCDGPRHLHVHSHQPFALVGWIDSTIINERVKVQFWRIMEDSDLPSRRDAMERLAMSHGIRDCPMARYVSSP